MKKLKKGCLLILLTVLVSTTEMSSNVLAFESERADYYEIDTDGDGLKDIYEMEILNPKEKDSDGNGIPDGNEDTDNDGLTNLEEQDLGTNINKADTDGDKLEDYDEIYKYKTDPVKRDSDDDLLSDGTEIKILDMDPNNPDEDEDGELDGAVPRKYSFPSNNFGIKGSVKAV